MGTVMSVKNGVKCLYILFLFPLLFPAFILQTEAQESSAPVVRFAQQRHTWLEEDQDSDDDRWREESERINRLRFHGEGNWQGTEEGLGSYDQFVEEVPARIQRLRMEGEKRQRAASLAWESRAKEIYRKWGYVRESSPFVYVDYTKNNDAFGGVNYESGFLEVGAIAPVFFHDAPRRVEKLLSERLSFLLRAQSMPGVFDLEGQVVVPGTGNGIRQSEVQEFSSYAVRSGEPPESYTAPDGVRRLRKQIRIEMVPDHLQTRVRQYLPYVEKAARIYEVAPELILAVIQTESVFNPRAVSHAGAVGLMQLVPSAGALEASKLVYGEPRLLTREELSRPDKNIELGAAYLRILLRNHFGDYRAEPRKHLFLVIASYNCGPRRVKRALAQRDIKSLSPTELYDLLIRVVPQETQVYLQRVVRHMQRYRSIMGRVPWQRYLVADFSKPNPAHPFLWAKCSPVFPSVR